MGSGLTELEALVQGSDSPRSVDVKTTLSRLSSELKQRFTRGAPSSYDFVVNALRILSKMKGAANADLRMTCLYDAGGFLFSNQYDLEALHCGRELAALAKRSGSKQWLRKAHMLQGIACSHIGDSGEAVPQFLRALELARELGDHLGEATVLSNLGTALNYAGLYREAIPCLWKSIRICREQPVAAFHEPAALCNLAQSHYFLGEHAEGMEHIGRCLELSSEPPDAFLAFSRVVRELTQVQIALELGKLETARKHSRACYHYSQMSGMKRGKFLAGVAGALCEIHGGDVARGLESLEESLAASNERGNVEYMSALKALVRGYDHASRPEQALDRLRVLLAETRQAREKGIFALLSATSSSPSPVVLAPEDSDLQELSNRESRLRATVAEREVITSRIEMLERLAITSDLKEEESGEHGYRVGKLAALLAADLDWGRDQCSTIEVAARLHDVGKVAIPDRILLSSNELREAERHYMSTHTLIGAELLAKSNIPQLRLAEDIARYHHEWWNGEGYPSKLKGKRIPIHARIVALADVFDALTHGRPFSKPWPMDRAIEEIRNRKGTQFDPELTDVFLALVQRLRSEHEDLDEYLGRAGRNSPFLLARNKIRMMLAEERDQEKKATVEGNETRH
jgi:putative two-component system response regulator